MRRIELTKCWFGWTLPLANRGRLPNPIPVGWMICLQSNDPLNQTQNLQELDRTAPYTAIFLFL
jgi:hypothetical protein